MTEKYHIALIEDDQELARLTTLLLKEEGYAVSEVHRGDAAVDHIRVSNPDLVILDIMLPGANGIEICTEVRKFYQKPILMLTGRDDDITEISSFRQGADDYVLKPVRPHLLLVRIEALLRRSGTKYPRQRDPVIIGSIKIFLQRREVHKNNTPIELSSAEFDMLALLTESIGQVVSREECCRVLRGISYDGVDRSVDMRISSLRKKLGDDQLPHKLIKTVRGKGYILVQCS
ncbi:response regulator [Microbulbifer sp. 2201CG32-9]|uniref:response regulator n=1 Tax=Microbulbifer sp. 2201CG32-9 TaxID=3232309 RepID=UPI00345BE46F